MFDSYFFLDLAGVVKNSTQEDSVERYVAHGILGASVAALQGNSALAGAVGAAGGEYAASAIVKYGYNKKVEDLTESEKQNISNLSQLASGLTVATISGGNMSDAGTAISASKNAVENNLLVPAIPVGIAVGESIATCFATGPCTAVTIATATAFAINLFSDETLSDENKKNNNSDNNAPTQLHNNSTSSGAAGLPPDDDDEKSKDKFNQPSKAPKTLQTGGNTVNQNSADKLNQQFGTNHHRRDWGRALENLKEDFGLRGDHHGKILSNGDYMSGTGRIVGNIKEYLP